MVAPVDTPVPLIVLAREHAPPHPLVEFWRYFRLNKGALAGLGVIVVLSVVALFSETLSPYPPAEQYRDALLAPPVWQEGGTWRFVLGTDDVGRDMLTRLIHGARVSMIVGVSVIALGLFVGVALGLLAGFFPGAIEIAIMRAMDTLLALPALLLAIVVVAILGPGLFNAMLAVSIVVLPGFARLTRAAVLTELAKDYVTAARITGARLPRLMFLTVLPNCMAPLIVQATLGFSTAILDTAALGFLGLGAQPPTPEWGTMLSDALQFIQRAWWVVTFPGIAFLVTVLAFNLMGDGLRDALDPKLKR